jgi:hypothetical protein
VSPDERREVLEQLLERVRRNAAQRNLAPPAVDHPAVDAYAPSHPGTNGVEAALHADGVSVPPPMPPPQPVEDDRETTGYLASPEPPAASPSRPLVRFEFEDEQTATGDPDQIEALVLAEAAAAEAAARAIEEPLDGPSTTPPPMPAGPTAPGGSAEPLELEDLDSLGAPAPTSAEAVPPPWVPPLPPPPAIEEPQAPAYVTPPPAYVAEPPAYVAAPPAYVPEPPAYEPPAYEPPAYEPPAYEPPAYVAAPPSSQVTEIADDDDSVIELDEADLASVPPEPMAAEPMAAAYEAGLDAAQAYDDAGPETDHAGFVDRQSIEQIEAAVLPADEPVAAVAEPAPESQRKVRELDRPIDDALEGVEAEEEPPPESGEVESQRYPSAAAPIVDEVSAERHVEEAELDEAPTPPPRSRALSADAGPSVSVIERPQAPEVAVAAYEGARPRGDDSFGALLDRALALGE